MSNWFELAKTYPLQDFIESAYGIEFRKNKCLCPFHADRNPSMNVVTKKEPHYFNCVVCGAGGDIVKFVEKMDNLAPTEAAKKVLLYYGVDVGKPMSEKEAKTAEEEQRKRIALLQSEGEKKHKAELKKKAKVIKEMTVLSEKLSNNLYEAVQNSNEIVTNEIEERFPAIYNNPEIRDLYLGWDYDHESLCVINRYADSGKTYNIKYYREKDKGGEYKPGKWISRYDSTTAVFGLDFLKSEGVVFVCEGEKDAINLMLLGLNAVTLGGVSNSWDGVGVDGKAFKEVLRDRDVVIWFDNDKAGYVNSVIKAKEIEEVARTVRAVMFFYLGKFSAKYDVSDYLQDFSMATGGHVTDAIAYSSFVMHNGLIDEIVERFSWVEKELWMKNKLLGLKAKESILDFNDCAVEMLKFTKNVRGEKEEEAKLITHLVEQLKTSKIKNELQKTINSLFPENSSWLGTQIAEFEKIISFKKTLMTQYVQTHIRDIVTELLSATKGAGYEFATYRDILYLWTGNYYYGVQKWEIESFVLQSFFAAAKVDFKKTDSKNA